MVKEKYFKIIEIKVILLWFKDASTYDCENLINERLIVRKIE
jgi:hypothetical protein